MRTFRRVLEAVRPDRGQVIILFAAIFTITMVAGVISIDLGMWLSDRRSAVKAADLAALAGSQDLPASVSKAHESAIDWAKRNGWDDNDPDVTVEVKFLCSNTLAQSVPGICQKANPSSPNPEPCSVGTLDDGAYCDSIRVTVRKHGTRIFSSFFGMGDINEGSAATATLSFDMMPLDTVMLLDSTASMGESPCKSPSDKTTPGCPIKEARDGANLFTDTLLPVGSTINRLGFAPFRGCYNRPIPCVPASLVIGLTNNRNTVHTGINATTAEGGSGTNVCLPFWQAQQMFSVSTSARKYMVILSDGDNNYNQSVADPPSARLPLDCRPSSASSSERELDGKARTLANNLAASGVEIYVVGFGVSPAPNSTERAKVKSATYCAGIGNSDGDGIADRRLLKCVASSTPGTNDHYFEVPHAADLPQVFQIIAWKIAGRALTQ